MATIDELGAGTRSGAESASAQLRERRRLERQLALVRPDSRTLILQATERLLGRMPLHELSVQKIMAEADVSRGTFYAYFSSKFEVAAGLLAETMREMFGVLALVIAEIDGLPSVDQLERILCDCICLWDEHRSILRATHENWHAVPELKSLWLIVVDRFTGALAAELDREQEAGLISGAGDHRRRVAAVLWSTEHLLYVAGSDVGDDLRGEGTLVEILIDLWSGVLYPGVPQVRQRGR